MPFRLLQTGYVLNALRHLIGNQTRSSAVTPT